MYIRSQSLILVIAVLFGLSLHAATSVPWMGTTFSIPSVGESDWAGATKVDGFLVSVGQNALSKAGGTYTLTGDVNFGTSYGLLSPYFTSTTSNAATAGVYRLANTELIDWRNAANSGNVSLGVNSSDQLVFNGSTIVLTSSGVVPSASGGTGFTSYTTGDLIYASSGASLAKLNVGTTNYVLTSNGTIPAYALVANANIDSAAAITRSKTATGTNYRILANNSSGVMSENAALTANGNVYADSNGQLATETFTAVSRGGTGNQNYAKGDLLYAASNGSSLQPIQIGSTGQVFKVSGGLPSWGAAGAALAVSAKITTYPILNTDDALTGDTTGSGFTMTLPDCATNSGKVFKIKKISSDVNALTISKAGSDTIQDSTTAATTTTLNTQGEEIEIASFGSTVWQVLSRKIPSQWVAFTPALSSGFGTVSSNAGYWRRVGDSIEIQAYWVNGTAAAALAGIDLPLSLATTSTKLSVNNTTANPGQIAGIFSNDAANGGGFVVTAPATSTSTMYFGNLQTQAGTGTPQNGSTMSSNNSKMSCKFSVPISGWNP